MSTDLIDLFQIVFIPLHYLKTLVIDTQNKMSAASSGQRNTMEKDSVPRNHGCSFLDLPSNVRQKIYEYALVKGCMHIEPVRCDKDQPWERKPPHFPLWCAARPVQKRTTVWDVGTLSKITYELVGSGPLLLSILQTCRQIYEESAPIFYSANRFMFECEKDQLSIPMAVLFLRDRPVRALQWIKCIKVMVGTDNSSSFHLFDDNSDVYQLRIDTLSFVDFLRNRLLGLKHLSIVFKGWPPDLRRSNEDDPIRETARTSAIGMLLLLPRMEYLSLQIWADPYELEEDVPEDPAILLAFAAFVRSCLLKGGDDLGTSNITVHSRHWLDCAYPPGIPELAVWRRYCRQLFVVRCSDKEGGVSLLDPVKHPSPTWTVERPPQLEGYSRLDWNGPYGQAPGSIEEIDYGSDDGGDDDSLLEFGFEDENLETFSTEDLKATLQRNMSDLCWLE